jgi:hypothetical protein
LTAPKSITALHLLIWAGLPAWLYRNGAGVSPRKRALVGRVVAAVAQRNLDRRAF